MRVRIPDAAKAAAGSDGHLTVVDQDSGWEYDFWQVRRKPRGGGRLVISWGGRTRIDGRRPRLRRQRRPLRLARGNHPCGGDAPRPDRPRALHARALRLRPEGLPGSRAGAAVRQRSAGAPSQGTRFQLDLSPAEIDALRAPAWKKTILRAMAEYGLYVGDTTGGTPWNIWFESGRHLHELRAPGPVRELRARRRPPPLLGRHVLLRLGERDQLAPPPAGGGPLRGRAELLGVALQPSAQLGRAPAAHEHDRSTSPGSRAPRAPPGPARAARPSR